MWWLLCFVSLVTAGLLGRAGAASISIRAINATANTERAARFVGIGYNLLTADPDAAGGGGVDPGYKTTRRVVDLDSSGQETFPRYSCVTRSTTSTIYDEKSFQNKFDLDVAADSSVSTSVTNAKFALSTSFSEAKDETTTQKVMTLEKQTLCNLGGARMKTELDVNRASQGFQSAVCQLPDSYDQSTYVQFINDWGTSYVIEVDVGIRNLTKQSETFSSVFSSMQNALAVGSSASVDYNAAFASVSGNVEMNMNNVESSSKFSESFKGTETIKVIGSQDYPEPIYAKVGSLHSLVTAAYFGSQNPSACTSARLAKLSTLQANLLRALGEYPTAKNVQVSSSDGKVRIPLSWPHGTYGLVKPKTSCPSGWSSNGKRKWDCEDDSNNNQVTSGHHFDGSLGSNIELKFCVKTVATTSLVTDMDWPVGEYCIYRYRSCPTGFSGGYLYWDDEDNKNANSKSGTVPDGDYGSNTRMYFCCRSDGHNTVPIFLPTDTPFYLLQATQYGCQEVAGMNVRGEQVRWDTEDSRNNDKKSGVIPYTTVSKNWRLYYCYYWK